MEKRKRGGQPGNKNAKGNRGGKGGPIGNQHAAKHGLYSQIILTDDEQEYLSYAESEIDWRCRWLDIKIYRLHSKIEHWKQTTDNDGFIHIKTRRVVRQWEKTDYTVSTYLGSAYLIFKAELILHDLAFERLRLSYRMDKDI